MAAVSGVQKLSVLPRSGASLPLITGQDAVVGEVAHRALAVSGGITRSSENGVDGPALQWGSLSGIPVLPLLEILSYVGLRNLGLFGKASRSCNTVVEKWFEQSCKGEFSVLSESLSRVSSFAKRYRICSESFGPDCYRIYFGVNVGTSPPLPADIEQILSSDCPVFPGKKVRDTHMLVLIPKTINGAPFTLHALNALVQAPLKGYPTKLNETEESWGEALAEHGPSPSPTSHWVLMTKWAVPDGIGMDYLTRCRIVERLGCSYAVPRLLDGVACVLFERLRTGVFLYATTPWVSVDAKTDGYRLGFGDFSASGLCVNVARCRASHRSEDDHGVAALRELCSLPS